jgi:hypothetical protein
MSTKTAKPWRIPPKYEIGDIFFRPGFAAQLAQILEIRWNENVEPPNWNYTIFRPDDNLLISRENFNYPEWFLDGWKFLRNVHNPILMEEMEKVYGYDS